MDTTDKLILEHKKAIREIFDEEKAHFHKEQTMNVWYNSETDCYECHDIDYAPWGERSSSFANVRDWRILFSAKKSYFLEKLETAEWRPDHEVFFNRYE